MFDPPVGIVTPAGWVRGICRNTIYCSAIGERRKEISDQRPAIRKRRSGGESRKAKFEKRRGRQDAVIVPRSLHCAVRRAERRRGGKGRAASVWMTDLGSGWSRVGMTDWRRGWSRDGMTICFCGAKRNPRPRHRLRAWGTLRVPRLREDRWSVLVHLVDQLGDSLWPVKVSSWG